jgi:hypothetical protein
MKTAARVKASTKKQPKGNQPSYAGKAPPKGTPGPFAKWGSGKNAGY